MSVLLIVAVGLAGGVGSGLRFLADGAVRALLGERLPWGTMLVNATGSLLLGLLTGASTNRLPAWWVVVGAGLLGERDCWVNVRNADAVMGCRTLGSSIRFGKQQIGIEKHDWRLATKPHHHIEQHHAGSTTKTTGQHDLLAIGRGCPIEQRFRAGTGKPLIEQFEIVCYRLGERTCLSRCHVCAFPYQSG